MRSLWGHGGFISIGPDEAYAQAIARLDHEIAQAILQVTLESRTLLRQFLQEEAIACDYREPGHLHLALTEEELHSFAQSSNALQRDGVPTSLLGRERLQEYIHTPLGPQILGGLFVPDVRLVHPAKLVQGLITAAQRYGAQPVVAMVQQIQSDGKSVQILTEQGSISTGSVVVATNAWIPDLLPQLAGLHVSQRWAGLMAFTPDLLPIADRIPGLPYAWVVGGFCGHGMPFGLRFGQLLAEAITKNSMPARLSHFRLDRVSIKNFGL